jgi:ATP/maltotriose-dependent transcriptional regulator MalT
LWDLGDCDRGKALVQEGIAMTRLLHYDFVTALGLARMGRISQVEGDRALAAQRYGESLKMWWSSGSAVYYDRSLVGLAGLAVDTGRANVAARLLGAVEAIQEGTGALSLMWPEERDRAAVSARAALGEGEYLREFAAGREIDAEAVKVEALALVDALSASATDVNSETGRVPFGLSGRELEVLRLLAGGQSDRQIGETLFCSHRTVNSHVAHIYQKLGVNSRAEATLVAQRAGLLAD